MTSPIDPEKFKKKTAAELAQLALDTSLENPKELLSAKSHRSTLRTLLKTFIEGAESFAKEYQDAVDPASPDAILSNSTVALQHLLSGLSNIQKGEKLTSAEQSAFKESPKIIRLFVEDYQRSAGHERNLSKAVDENREDLPKEDEFYKTTLRGILEMGGEDLDDPEIKDKKKSYFTKEYYKLIRSAETLETVILPILRQLGEAILLPLNEPPQQAR